ncbi:MAG: bacillithiol biosynthesis deacetylase BshB1 [Bacteroidetes bacterium]|nr:bacillithiol biosynthesis deacetylase BshB1 [Bacteroidota bacterium]
MKLDILCFGAHPDDVELSCSGTILRQIDLGYKVGIVDLTQGELGTRGSAELRLQEAKKAAEILGISCRDNLGLADGFFRKDRETLLKIITKIRQYQPDIILCNSETDRHIDHGRAGDLIEDASFLSGLRRIETQLEGTLQEVWRPKSIYHYIQDRMQPADLLFDITPYIERKIESIKAFSSQFYDADSTEPETPISGEFFFDFIKSRAMEFGRNINVKYAEGFTVRRTIGSDNLMHLL